MDDTLAPPMPTRALSIDRRTLLKAGVWAAPVIVLATAAPAAAATSEELPTGYVVNPTPGNLAPDLVFGATGATSDGPAWGSAGSGFGKTIYVQTTPSTPFVLWYTVPSTSAPLASLTSSPATWRWTFTPDANTTGRSAQWFPDPDDPTRGSWRLSATSASWNESSGYALSIMVSG